MMKFLNRGIILCVFLALLVSVTMAQDAIKIPIKAVVRGANGDPIKGATISTTESEMLTISNQLGEFSLEIPSSTPITVNAVGYKSTTVIATAELRQVVLSKEDRLVNIGFKNVEES
ncbi:MAG: carboxypeptidase-like regulatory domain-containing protein, partial [Bacteroidia bacterium]